MSDSQVYLDIGFNRNFMHKIGNRTLRGEKDCPSMASGFTIPHKPGNPVVIARRLKKGQRMGVALYDLTPLPAETSEVPSIGYLNLTLRFEKALEQTPDSPIVYRKPPAVPEGAKDAHAWSIEKPWVSYSSFVIHPVPDEGRRGHSTVFEQEFPSWSVHPALEQSTVGSYNQLNPEMRWHDPCFEVRNRGSFYFTIELQVGWKDGPDQELEMKTFVFDPEMLVDTDM